VRESRQSEGGDEAAQPASKVVRLPRDWLGPREELVPFGRQATTTEAEPGPARPAGPSALIAQPPPSGADFWGERSAAIHDVVQPPGEDISAVKPRGRFAVPAWQRAVTAAGLAVLAATAIVVLSAGSGHRVPAGQRSNMAAMLSSSFLRVFKIVGPPRIIVANRLSRTRIRPARHVVHQAPPTKPSPHTTSPHTTSPRPPAPTYAARATPGSATPPDHSSLSSASPGADASPPQASTPRSTGQSVGPTGQSGALGPVSSPNG
jgi:hypothetical protein